MLKPSFYRWKNHYDEHLENMYNIFVNNCRDNEVIDWVDKIDYLKFCYIVYNNSSKYLSPWL